MVGTLPSVTTDLTTFPLPRRPLDPSDPIRRWYENELGWTTVPAGPGNTGTGLRLAVGPHFDVLDVPAEAGRAALRHLVPGSPVALQGDRMRLLVAAGNAEELPGVLDWLEWGGLTLDLTAIGEGGVMDAPLPPEAGPPTPVGATPHSFRPGTGVPGPGMPARLPYEPGPARARGLPYEPGPAGGPPPLAPGRSGAVQGAAVWVRPPEPGCDVEASLPTLSAMGGGGDAPDLVRLLDTVAAQCHRLRLRRACAQPSTACQAPNQALAFS
ncbi:SCO3374 family protein [Streptomyces sp. NPDC050619]|uniref:SCO3374 family protein n=1 Tax=Streptomyces sp. NPDC050619 TaxID=3157214 RepID=UPI0034174A64